MNWLRALPALAHLIGVTPRPLWHCGAEAAARIAAGRGPGRALANNLKKLGVDPDRGMIVTNLAGYYRYFVDAAALGRWSRRSIAARTVMEIPPTVKSQARLGPVVIALTHSGNWDLAGAGAARVSIPVLTVAERLADDRTWEFFTSTRARRGIEVLPAQPGIFDQLLTRARDWRGFVALVADRDLTGSGIPVGTDEPMLFAPGPAALALRLGAPLYLAQIEDGPAATLRPRKPSRTGAPRRGPRRWRQRLADLGRAARGDQWVTRVRLHRVPIATDDTVPSLTQRWGMMSLELLRRHPEQWHMLQKVFVSDLDPHRLARAAARQRQRAAGRDAGEDAPPMVST